MEPKGAELSARGKLPCAMLAYRIAIASSMPGRGALWAHSPPSHSSKTVLPTVHVGEPFFTLDRTIFELWLGAL